MNTSESKRQEIRGEGIGWGSPSGLDDGPPASLNPTPKRLPKVVVDVIRVAAHPMHLGANIFPLKSAVSPVKSKACCVYTLSTKSVNLWHNRL
jgi:hypothetical protein